MVDRKNKNRGYRQLRLWQDAITFYVETEQDFDILDRQAFKPENGPLRLIESLERKAGFRYMDTNTDHQRIERHLHERKCRPVEF